MQKGGSHKPPKTVFLATMVVVFFSTLSAADSVGFVPCQMDDTCAHSEVALNNLPELGQETSPIATVEVEAAVLPERIVINAIDLDLAVQNPATRDIAALDALLKNGPARYVDSAKLGEGGNMIIFAHSSHLPVVRNQMYRAFNRIPELQNGDTISIEGGGKQYLYSVTSLRQVDVESTVIDISPSIGKKLTLVTCDTLTGKSARYILEADLVGVYPTTN